MPDVRVVDERDIVLITEPIFRVWKILDAVNRSVEVIEIAGMSLAEVTEWAEINCASGYSLSVVRPVAGGLESTWLYGRDPNDSRDQGAGRFNWHPSHAVGDLLGRNLPEDDLEFV